MSKIASLPVDQSQSRTVLLPTWRRRNHFHAMTLARSRLIGCNDITQGARFRRWQLHRRSLIPIAGYRSYEILLQGSAAAPSMSWGRVRECLQYIVLSQHARCDFAIRLLIFNTRQTENKKVHGQGENILRLFATPATRDNNT